MSCAACSISYAAAVRFLVGFKEYRAIEGCESHEGLFVSRQLSINYDTESLIEGKHGLEKAEWTMGVLGF
jgi:hypothetical protein